MITFPNMSAPWVVPHSLWHVDFRYDNPTADDLFGLKVFAFFGDVTARGGGTVVITRSHRIVARFLERQPRELRGDFRSARLAFMRHHPWLRALATPDSTAERNARFMDQEADVDGIGARVVELTGRAGDVVITHPWTVHHVAPNTNDVPRFMRGQSIYLRGPTP
jgi:ectoine hydroxylase-related dioxygenase (phytanoyl-CoA dioxygenase family)